MNDKNTNGIGWFITGIFNLIAEARTLVEASDG